LAHPAASRNVYHKQLSKIGINSPALL